MARKANLSIRTVNVILINDRDDMEVGKLASFPETKEGNAQAEVLFREWIEAIEGTLDEDDWGDALDERMWDSEWKGVVILLASSTHPGKNPVLPYSGSTLRGRRKESPIERAKRYQKLKREQGLPMIQIAAKEGLKPQIVRNHILLLRCPLKEQAKVHTGELSVREALRRLREQRNPV